MPEIALAKVDPEAPLDVVCTLACGATTGIGAALYIAKVEPGSTCVVFGAGLVGPRRRGGLPPRRRRADRRDRPVRGPPRARPRPGRHGHARRRARTRSTAILEMTGGFGADYTFEATGNVAVMRQAVEAARMGWGLCTIAGVAGKGEVLEVIPRFLITGRRVAGASFGGAKGRDRVPELVDLYLSGRPRPGVARDQPRAARSGQRRLRGDGAPGRHPHRHHVLMPSAQPRAGPLRGAAPPPATSGAAPRSARSAAPRRRRSAPTARSGSISPARRSISTWTSSLTSSSSARL